MPVIRPSRRNRIPRIQLIIFPLFLDQLVVGAALYDPSLLQHHDAVGILDGGKPQDPWYTKDYHSKETRDHHG